MLLPFLLARDCESCGALLISMAVRLFCLILTVWCYHFQLLMLVVTVLTSMVAESMLMVACLFILIFSS